MPTYAYKCRQCQNAFDIQQAFTDDALTVCPSCGGPLRKVFGTVGVTFNGSGFYRTDSRAPSGEKSTSSDSDTSTKKKEPAATGSTGSAKDGASSSGSGSSAQTSNTKAASPTP